VKPEGGIIIVCAAVLSGCAAPPICPYLIEQGDWVAVDEFPQDVQVNANLPIRSLGSRTDDYVWSWLKRTDGMYAQCSSHRKTGCTIVVDQFSDNVDERALLVSNACL